MLHLVYRLRPTALWFVLLALGLQGCYITRAYRFRKFELKDIPKLDTAMLAPSATPFQFAQAAAGQPARYPRLAAVLDSQLANTRTYAFLVIKNDSILYERYFNGLSDSLLYPSFSVAKSFVSTLVAMAHEDGKIPSLQAPITDYLPQLLRRDERFGSISIQHLLDMASGIKSSENYDNPFSDVLKLGFTKNISRHALRLDIEKAPGNDEYKSINTQLLAMIVEKATGQPLQQYVQQKLWQPLGMESAATWNIDSRRHQQVRAFCCLNATARDFAKLGRLYLENGEWNGQQLLSPQWIHASTATDTMIRYNGYRNQWWAAANRHYFTDSAEAARFAAGVTVKKALRAYNNRQGQRQYRVDRWTGAYHAEGILGQYVYVHPSNRVIIVRLGYYWQHPQFGAEDFIYSVGDQLK